MNPRLHNDKNVYIIGAGFSVDAGLPVLGNFMNRMRDAIPWLSEHGCGPEIEAIQSVLHFRQESAAAAYRVNLDVENIEDLFSLAAATRSAKLENHMVRAIAGTLHFAERTGPKTPFKIQFSNGNPLGKSWKPLGGDIYEVPKYDFYVGILSGLFAGKPLEDNAFITFNYDTLIERAANRLGIFYDYGFPRMGRRDAAHANVEPPVRSAFRLLKLHGSVSWANPGSRSRAPQDRGTYEDVRNAGLLPLLVPPTWKKGTTLAVSAPWDAAVDSIEEATRLIMIGCSIPATDTHLRFLLAAGLRKNISLRQIDFVNPIASAADVKARVLSVFRDSHQGGGILKFHTADLEALCRGHADGFLGRGSASQLKFHA